MDRNETPPDQTIRVLMLEDSEDDCALVLAELKRNGFDVQLHRTETRDAFLAALEADKWDMIISDYNLPSYSGTEALKDIRSRKVDLPFILVSGTLGEQRAVEAMRSGAADYILKGDLTRLAPAVRREISEFRRRQRMTDALRESDEKFQQAQKMEAIGQLAGGVAHDFNNILAAILLYAEGICDREASGSPTRDDAFQIKKACERAASLTRQLLTFSRKQVFRSETLDLNSLIDNMVPMLQRLLGEQIRIQPALDRALPAVKTDPRQFEQVLLNLAVNARDAMSLGGNVSIRTRTAKRSGPQGGEVTPWNVVEFEDTGAGMSPQVMQKIFEPFFTTKGLKGTGLGLSTVYGIVDRSGGFVDVWSEPGSGTRFSIYLPPLPATAGVSEPKPTEEKAKARPGKILVVEDNDELRALLRRELEKKGFEVTEASDRSHASALIAESREPLDVMVADLTLPDGNGLDLAREARARSPGARIVITSGYPTGDSFAEELAQKGAAFVAKPFTTEQLLAVIRSLLDKSS